MKKINMTGIAYQIDDEGITQGVTVTFSTQGGVGLFNSSVYLTQDHMDEAKTLDDLTRKEFDAKAREVLKSWIDMA